MHSRFVPLLVLVLFGLAALLIQLNERKYTSDQGRLVVYEEAGRDAVILRWSSPVQAPMARRFEEAYTQWKGKRSRFIIELDSPGGAVAEGKRVIQLMERIKSSHDLEMRVGRGADCLSMCVPIYLQGDERIAHPRARFMFHEPATYDSFTDERVKEANFERRFVADRFFDRYFVNSPMTPEWRSWLENEWVGKDVWKTGKELVEEDSGVVTVLE